ncbi:hypothetical protein QBC45DRAFT_20243 [Copromyces sp. CBS 386.78]|nr:hypothetical protein QBC45DRAFT_20243 [Copromyces sp. CBS 386.78]
MTQSSTLHLLDTPLPSPSLLALLSQHLPHSLPVLRRLQYAANFPGNNGLATTPYSHVLYASRFSVDECLHVASHEGNWKEHKGRKHFAAAFVDLSRFPETQVWVYSTLEDYAVLDSEAGAGAGAAMATGVSFTERLGGPHSLLPLPEEEAKECDRYLIALLRRMRTIAQEMPVELELDPDVTCPQRRENWMEARAYLCLGNDNGNGNGNGEGKKRQGPKVLIGSLAEIHRHRLRSPVYGYNVQMHKTANIPDEIDWEVCQKWLFRAEALVSSSSPTTNKQNKQQQQEVSSFPTNKQNKQNKQQQQQQEEEAAEKVEKVMEEEGLIWDSVRNQQDVRLVQSRTSIQRQEDTLLGVPSVVVRRKMKGGEGKGEGQGQGQGQMVAWGFMAVDGSLMTLHVEDQYRGKGLAKAVACKVMRDHIRDYGDDGWGAADVFVGNVRSQGVCRSIGGRVGWLLSWAVVDLSTVGDAL